MYYIDIRDIGDTVTRLVQSECIKVWDVDEKWKTLYVWQKFGKNDFEAKQRSSLHF